MSKLSLAGTPCKLSIKSREIVLANIAPIVIQNIFRANAGVLWGLCVLTKWPEANPTRKAASVPIAAVTACLMVLTARAARIQANGVQNPPVGCDCCNIQFLTGYETVDRDTLKVRARPSASYEVDISDAQCLQIDLVHRVAIESTRSS